MVWLWPGPIDVIGGLAAIACVGSSRSSLFAWVQENMRSCAVTGASPLLVTVTVAAELPGAKTTVVGRTNSDAASACTATSREATARRPAKYFMFNPASVNKRRRHRVSVHAGFRIVLGLRQLAIHRDGLRTASTNTGNHQRTGSAIPPDLGMACVREEAI